MQSLEPFGRMQVRDMLLQPQAALQPVLAVRARVRSGANVLADVASHPVDRPKFARAVRALQQAATHAPPHIDVLAPMHHQLVDRMEARIAQAAPIVQPLALAQPVRLQRRPVVEHTVAHKTAAALVLVAVADMRLVRPGVGQLQQTVLALAEPGRIVAARVAHQVHFVLVALLAKCALDDRGVRAVLHVPDDLVGASAAVVTERTPKHCRASVVGRHICTTNDRFGHFGRAQHERAVRYGYIDAEVPKIVSVRFIESDRPVRLRFADV